MADIDIPPLRTLYLYLTDQCNLACKHCWIMPRAAGADSGQVDLDSYKRFVDQAITLGLKSVKISGGEPLLRKRDVLELVAYCSDLGIGAGIETNGTLLDGEIVRQLRDRRTGVSVSLDGSDARLHEELRITKGCYLRTRRGMCLLKDAGIPFLLIMAIYKRNMNDLAHVAELAAEHGCYAVKINPILRSGRAEGLYRQGDCLSAVELYTWLKEVEALSSRLGFPILSTSPPAFHSFGYIARKHVVGGRCGFRNLLGVLADGRVSFCGMGYGAPPYIFGQISSIDLQAVWRSHPVLQAIRSQIPGSLAGVCKRCIHLTTCQGACRANTYTLTGSLLEAFPECQSLFEAGLFPVSRLKASAHRSTTVDTSHVPDAIPRTTTQPREGALDTEIVA